MTKRAVETLVAKANELAEKGSWIRSGLKKWLEMWKEATATDLKDESLKRVDVWDRPSARMIEFCNQQEDQRTVEFYVQTYYLERGYDRVCWLWGEAFERGQWNVGSGVDVDEEDMAVLRAIIRRLAGVVDRYIAELAKAGQDYDKLVKLLPAAEQGPIKLTTYFWALPRPAPDGAGWLADIVNVSSQTMATTPTVDTRCAAIAEARRAAQQMEEGKETE